MPIKKAGFKALRQSTKKTLKNRKIKSGLKSLEKKIRQAINTKNSQTLKELTPLLYKSFDKAAKAGVIKQGTAKRKKSRLMRLLNASLSPALNQ